MARSEGWTPAGLFPDFVCRLSGLPTRYVESLRAHGCARLLERLHEVDERLEEEREPVSGVLHRAVGATGDAALRRRLLQLRRNLFRLDPGREADMQAARAVLAPADRERVDAFREGVEEQRSLEAALRDAYRAETEATREEFRRLLDDEGFQSGLLLSSRSLYEAQARYRAASGAELGGAEDKTERALLRYFTRAAMKATPFSSLCVVLPGVFEEAEADEPAGIRLERVPDPRARRSLVRLNKTLLASLASHFQRHPPTRRRLQVERNPTLMEEGDRLVFLAVRQGREVFQRVDRNPVLDLTAGVVAERGPVRYADLVEALLGHPDLEASEEEVTAYLDRLLDAGFLRFRFGIREQDVDWDLRLREFLEETDDEQARAAAEALAGLRALAGRYGSASARERPALLEESRATVQGMMQALGGRTPQRGPAVLPFFEDVGGEGEAYVPASPELRGVEESLASLLDATRRLAYPRADQATMRHFFDTHYGGARGEVPVLRFYEDFHREHLKEHLARQLQAEKGATEGLEGYDFENPLGLEFVDGIERAKRALRAMMATRWREAPDAEEIDLRTEEIAEAIGEVPQVPSRGVSLEAFVELIPRRGPGHPARMVLTKGGYSVGYGKFFSRFLSLFPDAFRQRLMASNAEQGGDTLAEICGDGNMNANLHPPLLPWEISYPTGESGVAEEQLSLTAVVVERDPEDPHALVLRHLDTGRRVVPVDLGFVNRLGRPPLHQLLVRFTPVSDLYLPLPSSPYDGVPPERRAWREDGSPAPTIPIDRRRSVERRPRIVVDGRVVIARGRWLVTSLLLPQREKGEGSFEFFLRVQRWRRRHGIPAEAYIRLYPWPELESEPSEGGEEAERRSPPRVAPKHDRASVNLTKPQYVDFRSPLLVNLFGRIASGVDSFVAVLEERYPAAGDLPRHGEDTFAAEQLVQVNLPTAPASPVPSLPDHADARIEALV
ncbi:MAG: lantibiotic dehydratase [Gemmatimonadetes bacterium]|nr:lantibiotic dehydratase [Gemmatimonadota bacterium]